jgi:hypothetical protein
VAITSINGITGPTVTFAGGTSGFSFAPGGTTITLVSPITTKGDLYTRNATTGDRLPVGANTFVLTADSSQALGIKWAAAATGTVTGTGVSGQVAFWDGTSDIAGDSDFTFATDTLTVTKLIVGGGAALTSSGAGGALGTAAFKNTGTSGNTVPLLDGTNTFSGLNVFSLAGDTPAYFKDSVSSNTGLVQIGFRNNDTGGTERDIGALRFTASGGTSSTFGVYTYNAGSAAAQLTIGPTGVATFTSSITTTNLTDSGLTSGRVVIASTGGLLADDSDLTFSGDTLTVTKLIVGAGSALTSTGPGGALTTLAVTAPGTGVATALAVNVGTAGSFVVNGGALGTPSGGTVTNLTGTASININGTVGATTPAAGTFTSVTDSGLTAGRVTFAGTGGLLADDSDFTFSVDTLTVTKIAAHTLTGTISGGGNQINNIVIGASTPLAGSFTTLTLSDLATFNTPANAIPIKIIGRSDHLSVIQWYKNDATTLEGSLLAQTGLIALRDSANANQIEISTTGVALPALTTDATLTTRTVCQRTSDNILHFGSGVAGICLGTSSERFKEKIADIKEGLNEVLQLVPRNFRYKKNCGDSGDRLQFGFVAEEVEPIMPNVVVKGAGGEINSVDYGAFWVIYAKAIQDLHDKFDAQIELLNTRLNTLMT